MKRPTYLAKIPTLFPILRWSDGATFTAHRVQLSAIAIFLRTRLILDYPPGREWRLRLWCISTKTVGRDVDRQVGPDIFSG